MVGCCEANRATFFLKYQGKKTSRGQRGKCPVQPLGYVKFTKVIFGVGSQFPQTSTLSLRVIRGVACGRAFHQQKRFCKQEERFFFVCDLVGFGRFIC